MKFFIDSADLREIEFFNNCGLVDGVTTNPSLIAASGQDLITVAKKICQMVKGPVSLEVGAIEAEQMIKEGLLLSEIAPNAVIKLPMTLEGIKACNYLSSKNIKVNVTLCFSAAQAILAAKSGAAFISPFIGRLDDNGQDGIKLVADIKQIYNNYPQIKTEIIVASIRNPYHLTESAKIGADIATIPPKVMHQLVKHHLTDLGLELFIKDWNRSGQQIL